MIGAMRELLVGATDVDAAFARLTGRDTRIVSLTVTEKGYCLDARNELDPANADIAHDLGNPSRPRCINIVALKRNRFSAEAIQALSEAHRLIYRSKVGLDHAREMLRSADLLLPPVNHLLSFLQNQHEGRNGRGRDRRRAA